MTTLTSNNFKSTTVRGNFFNADYPDSSILASATFDRDATIKGNLYIGNETSNTIDGITTYNDTGGNIVLKYNNTIYSISPLEIIQLKESLISKDYLDQYINNGILNQIDNFVDLILLNQIDYGDLLLDQVDGFDELLNQY